MKIKFCHISPPVFNCTAGAASSIHLTLAHLVEEYGEAYCTTFQDGKEIILDNSGFELYKQNKPMYDPNKLIEMGQRVCADYIVLPDYPGEKGQKTIDAALAYGPKFKEAGFKTFFVPQSEIGDLEDYLRTLEWAVCQDWIDLIGISILGVPNAYSVEKDNKLQRFLSRWKLFEELERHGWFSVRYYENNSIDRGYTELCKKRFHFLGMTDGPNEIDLVKTYHDYIYSWDSSAAVWAGMNGIEFDESPTGLINGKFEHEVDFSPKTKWDREGTFELVNKNIKTINEKL